MTLSSPVPPPCTTMAKVCVAAPPPEFGTAFQAMRTRAPSPSDSQSPVRVPPAPTSRFRHNPAMRRGPLLNVIFEGDGSVLPEPKLTLPLVFTHSELNVAPRTVAENPLHERLTVPSFWLEKVGPRSVTAGSVDPAGDSMADTE